MSGSLLYGAGMVSGGVNPTSRANFHLTNISSSRLAKAAEFDAQAKIDAVVEAAEYRRICLATVCTAAPQINR
jgi:hypothetical protein